MSDLTKDDIKQLNGIPIGVARISEKDAWRIWKITEEHESLKAKITKLEQQLAKSKKEVERLNGSIKFEAWASKNPDGY